RPFSAAHSFPLGLLAARYMPRRIVRIGSQAFAMRQGALQLCCRLVARAEQGMADGAARTTASWVGWIMAVALLGALAGCARTPPEDALREAFDGVQAAIEARDAGDLAGFLAEDFIGPGGLDRDGARRLAALHFMRH